jgi:hypothetical protein
MARTKGSKNKVKEMKETKETKRKVGRPKKQQEGTKIEALPLEEDVVKLRHTLDRIPMLSDDGYRIKETIGVLKLFGYSSKQIKKFLIDGTIPLK